MSVTTAQETVSATITVAASAARVVAVLADATTHAAIDGTGWVREAPDPAPLAEVGQLFRMDMYHSARAVGDYQVVNKVVVFDAPNAIGWLTGYEKPDGELAFGGWVWRYDLTPRGTAEVEVTLTYDWSAAPQDVRDRISFPPFGPDHLANSLRHLATLAA